jgi:hypothetical protein
MIDVDNVDKLENNLKSSELILVKFDDSTSKYDEFITTLNCKVINITDKEIIYFYDIEVLPTICIYKNKNLIDTIEGFQPKTAIVKKLLSIINN